MAVGWGWWSVRPQGWGTGWRQASIEQGGPEGGAQDSGVVGEGHDRAADGEREASDAIFSPWNF